MNEKLSEDALMALKIAFTYMPRATDVNRYDHGDQVDRILADIQQVKEILLLNHVDPDEVYDEVHPGSSPNSCY